MSNEILPTLPGLSWGLTKTPAFNTRIQAAVSGYEVRSMLRANPMWRFSLSYDFLNGKRVAGQSQLDQLMGFFQRHRGAYDSFLYEEINDKAVVDHIFAAGTGTTRDFQLVRVLGGFAEALTNINQITNIKINGVLKTPGTDYSVSARGVVSFVNAPPNGASIMWTGSYFFRARFADDHLEFVNEIGDIWSSKKVELVATLGARL